MKYYQYTSTILLVLLCTGLASCDLLSDDDSESETATLALAALSSSTSAVCSGTYFDSSSPDYWGQMLVYLWGTSACVFMGHLYSKIYHFTNMILFLF